jgi:hypothetical protein
MVSSPINLKTTYCILHFWGQQRLEQNQTNIFVHIYNYIYTYIYICGYLRFCVYALCANKFQFHIMSFHIIPFHIALYIYTLYHIYVYIYFCITWIYIYLYIYITLFVNMLSSQHVDIKSAQVVKPSLRMVNSAWTPRKNDGSVDIWSSPQPTVPGWKPWTLCCGHDSCLYGEIIFRCGI